MNAMFKEIPFEVFEERNVRLKYSKRFRNSEFRNSSYLLKRDNKAHYSLRNFGDSSCAQLHELWQIILNKQINK